jgi:cation transport ATPase
MSDRLPNEITLENKAQKKRMRRTVGSMIFILLMLLTQAATLHTFFTWKSLLFIVASVFALGVYAYGLVDVAQHGACDARRFNAISSWALIGYIVVLLIIDTIF